MLVVDFLRSPKGNVSKVFLMCAQSPAELLKIACDSSGKLNGGTTPVLAITHDKVTEIKLGAAIDPTGQPRIIKCDSNGNI